MLKDNEIMVCLKTIELLSHEIDVSSYDYEHIKNTFVTNKGNVISKVSSNVDDYYFQFDESCSKYGLYSSYACRSGRAYELLSTVPEGTVINTIVNEEILLGVIRMLYKNKVLSFSNIPVEILDEEYMKKISECRKNFDRKSFKPDVFIEKMTKEKTRDSFNALVNIIYKDVPEVLKGIVDVYNKDFEHFNIAGFEDYPVYDGRLFIPLNDADLFDIKSYIKTNIYKGFKVPEEWEGMKYLVISKNPYDWFFCSYGSMIQSCYSINSSHFGLFGTLPFIMSDDTYMFYVTKEHPAQFNLFADGAGKIDIPYTYFRSWMYVEKDTRKPILDKMYGRGDDVASYTRDAMYATVLRTLGLSYSYDDKSNSKYIASGEDMLNIFKKYKLKFYPDSLYRESSSTKEFKFKLNCGEKNFIGDYNWGAFNRDKYSPADCLKCIKSVAKGFDVLKPSIIVSNVLTNLKLCPITGLRICQDVDKSPYAKYLNSPVTNTIVFTYIDNMCYVCESTKQLSKDSIKYENTIDQLSSKDLFTSMPSHPNKISLENLKNILKGNVETSGFDVILLKVVDADKISFIKYKKKGVY